MLRSMSIGFERLIPAHAGKTYRDHQDWYHPSGSSPLTRGKRSVREDEWTMTGLIPAHAGKTDWPLVSFHM